MENFVYDYKNHSNLFNKYYCIIENASDIDVYYSGVYDFLKYKFRQILIEKLKEKVHGSLNGNDFKFLQNLKYKDENDIVTLELKTQFNVFLKTFFDGVNRFEREQFPCYNTGLMFRKLNELIQLLDEWGSIPEYWLKIKKYCKYKAVDIFKKLKNGDIPKTGGPKEKITKNDIENKELFEYAKQENMDLNEINKAIYNQRNGNGKSVHSKDEDDKDLKQFLNFQDKKKNNNNNQENRIPNNNKNENNDKDLEEFRNEISTDLINENKIENKNLKKIENVKKKISNINSKIISNENKEIKNPKKDYESIGRASLITYSNDDGNKNFKKVSNKEDSENYDSISRASPVRLKDPATSRQPLSQNNINHIFSKNHQNTLFNKKSNYEFLDEVVESKLKQRRIASISNRIIDQDYIEKESDEPKNKNILEKNKQNQQPHTSRETQSQLNMGYKKINHQNKNPFINRVNNKKDIVKKITEVESDNDITININRTRSILYNKKESLNDIKNNSLYIVNEKKDFGKVDQELENISNMKENNVSNENNIYEDINLASYDSLLNKNSELHSFNPKNSFNKIKGEFKNINSVFTPQPPEDQSYSNISNSVFISTNFSDKSSNQINQDFKKAAYEKEYNQDTSKLQNTQNQINVFNQPQNPVYSEIPCVLGAGYKFSYDKYIGSANQNIKKVHFIDKIAHSNHKNEDDIEKMIKDLKGINNTGNVKNQTKDNIINDNKEKEKSPIKENIKPQVLSQNNNKSIIVEDNNIDLTKQKSKEINSPNKNKIFSNLNTNLLKNFDLRNYKNLPNFEIPLQYNTPEIKTNLKKFFINTAKESLFDMKKDDIQSSIKKMELLLYYFTNMKDN